MYERAADPRPNLLVVRDRARPAKVRHAVNGEDSTGEDDMNDVMTRWARCLIWIALVFGGPLARDATAG